MNIPQNHSARPRSKLLRRILELSALEFEHLTYDLLTLKGLRNVSWRTPGTDGGRDLQGEHLRSDLSGEIQLERWYIECKRYSRSVDWPTLHAKISYAYNAEVDFFLLCTTSTLSSPCKDEVQRWRQRFATPRIRAWEGPQLERLVQREPLLLAKYGLSEAGVAEPAVLPLLHLAAKSSHSAHGAAVLAGGCHPALELSTALLELATSLLNNNFGATGSKRFLPERDLYPWALCHGTPSSQFNSYGIRALLAASRFLGRGDKPTRLTVADENGNSLILTPFPDSKAGDDIVRHVALLANLEISRTDNESLLIHSR